MKRKFLLIFVSMFLVFSFVGGAICLNADTLFSASTEAVETAEEEEDTPTQVQASGSWASYATNTRPRGNGTASNPYKISNAQELANYMYMVNNGYQNSSNQILYKRSYAELTANIDLSAHYWTPIGTGKHIYAGNFNGNGYTVSGVYINFTSVLFFDFNVGESKYDGAYNGGFFGVVQQATISNLTLKDGNIHLVKTSGILSGMIVKFRVGALVGLAVTSFSCYNIVNQSVSITFNYVFGVNWFFETTIGGLIGSCDSAEIESCYNFANLSSNELAKITVGGLVGSADNYVRIEKSGNFGNISGNVSMSDSIGYGGIIGAIGSEHGAISFIQDCVNYGDLKITYSRNFTPGCIGGILGAGVNNVYINRCVNYGNLQGRDRVGGIAGKMGSPQETTAFLFWSWVSKEACENVLIANCVNFGVIKGSSNSGIIAGEMNGQQTVKSNAADTSYGFISVGFWYNMGDTTDHCYAYSLDQLSSASARLGVFRIPNYNGTRGTYRINGWDYCNIGLNEGGVTLDWTYTTLINDLGIKSAPSSVYPYTLVPSYLLGTVRFKIQYKKSGSTTYDFESNDDSIKFYIKTISSSNYRVSEDNLWTEDNVSNGYGEFYFINGFSYSSGFDVLEIQYDASIFKAVSVSSAYEINESPTWKYTDISTSSKNRTNYVCFNPGLSSSSSFTFIFQSQAKSLSVTYKLGEYIDGDGRVDSRYNFKSILDTTLTRTTYSDSYLTISGQKTTYYYKDEVEDIMIAPNFGYAVLYSLYAENNSLYTKDGSDRYIESLNPNTEFEPDITYKGSIVDEIKPSSFVNETMSFDFQYDYELVIYLVPVWYDINVLGVGDGVPENKPNQYKINSYAFLDGSRGSGTSNIEKAATFYREERGSLNEDGLLEMTFRFANYFDYGYRYKIYASTDANEYETSYAGGTVTLYEPSDTTGQLNTNQELRFGMLDLVRTAFLNGGVKSDVIYVRIEREAIEYDVEFVNMVDSYTNPGLFVDRTSQGIGGSSSMTLNNGDDEDTKTTFNVLDVIGFALTPNYGYKMVGSSFYERPNFDESSGENVAPEETFSTLLLNYIINICDYNVNAYELRDNKITIYAYYQLQTYRIYYDTESCIGRINSSYYKGPGLTLESINSSEEMEGKTSEGDGGYYKEVYYYAPVTLSTVKNFQRNSTTYWDFIGWWERPIKPDVPDQYDSVFKQLYKHHFYELLSLNTEYTFFLNPEKVGGLNTSSITNTSDYEIYMVAMYEPFLHDETPLKEISPNVFEVSTPQDLVRLSTSVRLGNTYEGCVIKQTVDFDINSSFAIAYEYCLHLYPIGTKESPFKGTYDGQNHRIGNIEYGFGRGMYRYDVGLFGYTDGAVIKNLTIYSEAPGVLNTGLAAVGNAGVFIANAKDTTMINLNNYYVNVEFQLFHSGGLYLPYNVEFYNDDNYGWADVYNSSKDKIPELENAGQGDIRTLILPRKQDDPSGRDGKYFGGIVGKMDGGSIYASSVQAEFWLNASQRDQCAGLVGQISDGATIEECYVWDVTSGSRRGEYDVLANYLDDDESNGSITNSYYRFSLGTDYYNSMLEDGSFADFKVEDKRGGSGGYSLNSDIWFQLPNGYWTLRVFYWT